MRRLVVLLALTPWALPTPAEAQVPPVGATRVVGVDCLCPGQPITHHPPGTSCVAVCTRQAAVTPPPPPSTGSTASRRRTTTASSSTSTSLAVMSAVSGVMSVLGSYFEARAEANAAAAAAAYEAQMAQYAEQRRQAAVALERERRRFEQDKQSVLGRMLGPRVGELEFKGTTASTLQMKDLSEVTRAEDDARDRALDGWMRSRVARLRQDLEFDGHAGLFRFQVASDPVGSYSVEKGQYVTAPAAGGSTYSTDTGQTVVAPISASGGAYSVDLGRIVTPPPPTQGAYSVDTGKVVTPPPANQGGAYSVDTGRVVQPPAPSGAGAYSTDLGKIVVPPSTNPGGAYSVDSGRVVTPPGQPAGAFSTDTGRIVQPAGPQGAAYSTETGKLVTPPAADAGATPISGTGAGLTPAVTTYDGRYTATITLFGPPGVAPEFPPAAPFTFDVVNGVPQSNWVLGQLNANGLLTDGRSQVSLRLGPSGTLVVPIGGAFNQAINVPSGLLGTVRCGTGTCWVVVTVTRRTTG